MNIQSALADLMKVFLTFYIGCCAVGRGDIPFNLVNGLREKAIEGVGNTKIWGCPSIFPAKGDCVTFDPRNYKSINRGQSS